MRPPLVVIGVGPLPASPSRHHSASGLRAHQLAAALAATGAPTTLLQVGGETGGAGAGEYAVEPVAADEPEAALAERLRALRPAAVVGAGSHASYLAGRASSDEPVWVDLNGDPAAEGQAAAAAAGTDAPLLERWWLLAWCLRRGDRFSAISAAHRLALLGQLGASGRLNRANLGVDLVAVVPEAVPDLPPRPPPSPDLDPLVLFSGSFNTWTDGATLAEALRLALAEEPRLRFAATGGAVAGLPGEPWERFGAAIAALPPAARERVALRGWVTADELARLEEEAAAGVVPELPIAERELGGHNRSLRWMARGVPVVTTELSELGREAARAGAAIAYEPGDPRSLAAALLRCARRPAEAAALAAAARRWAVETRSIAGTTAPLVAWSGAPRPAPDRLDRSGVALARRHAEMLRDQLHLIDGG